MNRYEINDRVIVNSALQFARIAAVEVDSRGERRYTVEFKDGTQLSRYQSELT